jgi:C1A family cysteine protease
MNNNLLNSNVQSAINSHPTNTISRIDDNDNFLYLMNENDLFIHIDIPNSFDGRIVWEGLLTKPKNQGSCGSCWAFASTGCLADRFNIQSMGLINVNLSASRLVLCAQQGKLFGIIKDPEYNLEQVSIQEIHSSNTRACFGSSLIDAWSFLYVFGTNTDQCFPYDIEIYANFHELSGLGSFTMPEKSPICTQITGILGDMCSDVKFDPYTSTEIGTPAKFYRALHFYAIAGIKQDNGSEKNIRYDIFRWGPVCSVMKLYPDFYIFKGKGIYTWNKQYKQIGSHAIEIVGWGEQSNTKYWIVKNSWGTDWGDDGYFKILRGFNECNIEENVITGIPDFWYPFSYDIKKTPCNYIWSESKTINERRRKISSQTATAGGSDPENGYFRRILATMNWINLSRLIELKDLPDYKNWKAGINANVQNINVYQNNINSTYDDTLYTDQSLYTIIIIMSTLILILIICVFIWLKLKINNKIMKTI